MSLTRTLLFLLALALIATLALLVDGVALFAQTQQPTSQRAQPQQAQPQPQQTPQPTQAQPQSQPAPQPAQPRQGQPQQSQPQEPVPDGFRFKSSVELINVSATVVDSAERFVPNLHKE